MSKQKSASFSYSLITLVIKSRQPTTWLYKNLFSLVSMSMKTWKISVFGWKTHNVSCLQMVESFPRKCRTQFSPLIPKAFMQFLCECRVNLHPGNLHKTLRREVSTVWKTNLINLIRNNLRADTKLSAIQKRLPPNKTVNPLFGLLSSIGVVPSASCCCNQQKFESVLNHDACTFEVEHNLVYQ